MIRAPLLYVPEAAAFMHFMSIQYKDKYFNAVWMMREVEEKERNVERVVHRERVARILGALSSIEPPAIVVAPPRGFRLRLVERISACL